MHTLVVYESMYGNTHTVAEHIAEGLRALGEVRVVSVHEATRELVADAGLLVVGGPTHAHGLTSSATRKAAREALTKESSDLTLDAEAEGPGLRDWFRTLAAGAGTPAAAFDTRFDASPILTGRAAKGIRHRLRDHGFAMVTDPMSFLVDKANHLLPGEAERAEQWGRELAANRAVLG